MHFDKIASRIRDNYLNGNISDARRMLEGLSPIEAAYVAVVIYKELPIRGDSWNNFLLRSLPETQRLRVWMPQEKRLVDFTGKSKVECLESFRESLIGQADDDLHGIQIEQAANDTRKIVTQRRHVFEYGRDADFGQPWGVEIDDAGTGEIRGFATRNECVAHFIECCSHNGDHWC